MDQEDRIDIYTIPPNFAEEGTMLSGRIKTRNAVETAAVLLIAVPILLSLEVTMRTKMYLAMIFLVPVVILCVIGVQGESLFAFVASFFTYARRRRYLAPPDECYRMEQNRKKKRFQRRERSSDGKKGNMGKQTPEMVERRMEGRRMARDKSRW